MNNNNNAIYDNFSFDGQSSTSRSSQQTIEQEEYEEPSQPSMMPPPTGVPYAGRANQFLSGMKSGTFKMPELRDKGFKDFAPGQKQSMLQPSDPFVKQKLIFKLLRWKKAFPEELNHLIPEIVVLNKMDIESLENMFNEARYMVALINSTALESTTSAKTFQQLEKFLLHSTPIQAEGMTNALLGNIPFQKSLKEWTLENTEIFYSDPKYRTILLGGLTLYEVHNRNVIINQQKQFMTQPVKGNNGERMDNELQNILQDFADLSEMVKNMDNSAEEIGNNDFADDNENDIILSF